MEKAQLDKMIHDTNTCCTTNICSEEQEPQEEWQDEHRTLEQEVLQGRPWEAQQDKHLYGQPDNQIMHGDGQSTASSQKSSPSDSEGGSCKRERSPHSSPSDTGSCEDDRVKHLDMLNSDENPGHGDVHIGDASISDTAFESMHLDCISESSFSGNDSNAEHGN